MNDMLISVIIPALNEELNIEKCMESLKSQSIEKRLFEVILIDNGSEDGTVKLFQKFERGLNLKYYEKKNAKVSGLRNFGAAKANGENFAFLDADCSVPKNWLELGMECLKRNGIAAVGCSCSVPQNASWVAKTWDLVNQKRRVRGMVKALPTGGLFVSKKAFERVGGFNEQLETNEDFDLSFRLRKLGFQLFSEPRLSVTHWGVPNNIIEFYKREKWHGTHVLRVFLNDIKSMNNYKAVLYAVYYLIVAIGLILSFILSFIFDGMPILTVCLAVAFFGTPCLLSYRAISRTEFKITTFLKLYSIFLCYGIARAMSLGGLLKIRKGRSWIKSVGGYLGL
jgi:glycosyltransferase involved in cell wall biosynthesis